jgi:hypothetical protein
MTTEVKVRIEDVASGRAQNQLKDTIGDALAQTALIQIMRRAWYRRHGNMSNNIHSALFALLVLFVSNESRFNSLKANVFRIEKKRFIKQK